MENIGLFLVLLGSLLLLSEGPVLLLTLDGKRNPNLCVHLSCDTEASAETSETNFFLSQMAPGQPTRQNLPRVLEIPNDHPAKHTYLC